MEYTVRLSPAQQKALEWVTSNSQDWIENAVYNRCRIAIDDIVQLEVERITSKGGELKGTKEDIVLAASIKSVKEVEEEMKRKLQEEAGSETT